MKPLNVIYLKEIIIYQDVGPSSSTLGLELVSPVGSFSSSSYGPRAKGTALYIILYWLFLFWPICHVYCFHNDGTTAITARRQTLLGLLGRAVLVTNRSKSQEMLIADWTYHMVH